MKGSLLKNNKDNARKKNRASILGIGVDCLTLEAAKNAICERWGSNAGVFHVVTANAEMIFRSSRDRAGKDYRKCGDGDGRWCRCGSCFTYSWIFPSGKSGRL